MSRLLCNTNTHIYNRQVLIQELCDPNVEVFQPIRFSKLCKASNAILNSRYPHTIFHDHAPSIIYYFSLVP